MVLNYKPFEKELYKKFDLKAKLTCADYLESMGNFKLNIPITEQKELFKSGDFTIQELGSNNNLLCECEIKTVWTISGKWQTPLWNSIDIPYRKKDSKATIFFVINKNYDTLAKITKDILLASPIGYKNTVNKYTGTKTVNEPFFKISISQVQFFYKNLNKWIELVN